MKKLFTFILSTILFFNINAQQSVEKGSLLLEGNLSGVSWTDLSTTNSIGIYMADGFAMTVGYVIGIIEDESLNATLGARIHFNDSKLMKIDLAYDDPTENFAGAIGYAQRWYFKDWMSIQPQVSLVYSSASESAYISTGVGFNFHFEKM